MSIMDFVRKLLPSFGRKDVREKLRLIASRLSDIVRPSFDLTVDSLDERSLKSAYGKGFVQALLKYLPPNLRNSQSPFRTVIGKAIDNAATLVDQLSGYVDKHLGDQIHIEGLTYQKASVLRLIELLDFFADYAGRQLAYLVASETNIEAFNRPDGNPFTKAELKYLESYQSAYFKTLELLYTNPAQLIKELDKIPEILVAESEINEVPALSGGKADPLELGIIPGVSHIFHFVGIRLVHWENDRYERAKKEKRSIEMRLEAYRQRKLGQVDARTEAIIEGYERELTLIRQKISQMEERMQ